MGCCVASALDSASSPGEHPHDGPHLSRVVVPLSHRTTNFRHPQGQAMRLFATLPALVDSQSWPARRSVPNTHPSIRGPQTGIGLNLS